MASTAAVSSRWRLRREHAIDAWTPSTRQAAEKRSDVEARPQRERESVTRRSASLCLNLIATWLDVNEATLPPPAPGSLAREVELAVQVENAYVGSPCGNLDQIMIW